MAVLSTDKPARKTSHRPANRGATNPRRPFSTVFLILLCAYFLVPVWWLLVAATKSNGALFSGSSNPLFFDSEFSFFDNISQLISYSGGIYWRWLANSFMYAIVGGVGATSLCVLAGYGFAKYRFRGNSFAFSVLLGSVMVPATTLVIPLFMMLSKVSLIDTPWAVILPSMLNPMGVYIMRVYIQDAVPDELLEAARVDGAGEFRTFFQVALPLLKPAVVTVLLLCMVAIWNNYFLPLAVLSSTDLLPVTVGLGSWQTLSQMGAGGEQLWNLVVTGAFVSVLPLMISFLAMQRFWRGGLSLGSVK